MVARVARCAGSTPFRASKPVVRRGEKANRNVDILVRRAARAAIRRSTRPCTYSLLSARSFFERTPHTENPIVTSHSTHVERPGLGTALRRALRGRCPNCGQGRLMRSYLKQVETCLSCQEAFGHIRSDDAAPWLTIMIVGHIVVPILLLVEQNTAWPTWVAMTLWPTIALALALLVLPRAKTLFLGLIWVTRAPGSEVS